MPLRSSPRCWLRERSTPPCRVYPAPSGAAAAAAPESARDHGTRCRREVGTVWLAPCPPDTSRKAPHRITFEPLQFPTPSAIFHLTVSISLGSYWRQGGTRYKDCSSPTHPLPGSSQTQRAFFLRTSPPSLTFQDSSETLKHLWAQSQKSPSSTGPSQQPRRPPTTSRFIAFLPTTHSSLPHLHSPKEEPDTGGPTRVLEKEEGGFRGREPRVSLA